MRRSFFLAAVVLLLCLTTSCKCIDVTAYFGFSLDLIGKQSDWMSKLGDAKRLFLDLTIPGTHCSGSFNSNLDVLYRHQGESIKGQLKGGVRFLDIRLGFTYDAFLVVYNAKSTLKSTLLVKDVLQDVKEFLNQNNGEVVIMRLKKEYEDNATHKWKQDIVEQVFLEFNSSRDFACQSVDCAIGPSRGKIIFLEDGIVAPSLRFLNYSQTLGMQQDQMMTHAQELWSKWEKARDMLINVSGRERTTGVINFFSGGGEVFPYFVASGHTHIDSLESLQATALKNCQNHPWGLYPDFPRKDCKYCGSDTVCSIHYRGTNKMLYDWLRNGVDGEPQSRVVPYVWPRRLGILVMDFPEDNLILRIVEVNFASTNPFKGVEFIPKVCVIKCSSCIAGDIEIVTEGRGTVAARDVAVGDRVPGLLEGEWCDVVAAVRVSENGTVFGNFTSDHLIVKAVQATNSSMLHVIKPNGDEAPARNVDLANIVTTCPVTRTANGEVFTPFSTVFCSNLTWGQYIPLYSALLRIVAKTGSFWFDPSLFSAAHDTLSLNNTELFFSPGRNAGQWWDGLPDICSVMAACAADGQRCDELERMVADWLQHHVSLAQYELIASVYPNLGNTNAQDGRFLDDVRWRKS